MPRNQSEKEPPTKVRMLREFVQATQAWSHTVDTTTSNWCEVKAMRDSWAHFVTAFPATAQSIIAASRTTTYPAYAELVSLRYKIPYAPKPQ